MSQGSHISLEPPSKLGKNQGVQLAEVTLLVYVGKDSRQKGLIAVPSFAGILMAANHPCLAEIPQNSVEEQL